MASRSLDDLKPEFKQRAEAWLADCQASGLEILVYCTLRADDEQAKLYAYGRTLPGRIVTNAKPGQSAHGYGYALDFVPLLAGKPQWAAGNKFYTHAIDIAQLHGMESLAGSAFPEWAHLQMPGWRTLILQHTS